MEVMTQIQNMLRDINYLKQYNSDLNVKNTKKDLDVYIRKNEEAIKAQNEYFGITYPLMKKHNKISVVFQTMSIIPILCFLIHSITGACNNNVISIKYIILYFLLAIALYSFSVYHRCKASKYINNWKVSNKDNEELLAKISLQTIWYEILKQSNAAETYLNLYKDVYKVIEESNKKNPKVMNLLTETAKELGIDFSEYTKKVEN